MKLLLFTKNLKVYDPFVELCKLNFSEIKIIYDHDHPKRKDDNFKSFMQKINTFSPDYLLSFYYNRLIQKEILALVKNDCLNFHGSLLPDYSGPHAINWQILRGETKSGVTLHELTNKFDAGKIVFQNSFTIEKNDDANDVLKKGIKTSCELLKILSKQIKLKKELNYIAQIPTNQHFKCKKRNHEDGLITSCMSIDEIRNLSRALVNPWPGVFFHKKNGKKISYDRILSYKECYEIWKELNSKY